MKHKTRVQRPKTPRQSQPRSKVIGSVTISDPSFAEINSGRSKKRKRVQFRLSETRYDFLQAYAARLGKSMTEVIEIYIDQLKREEARKQQF